VGDFTAISYEVRDGVATITLDRPDALNALDAAMERELVYAWDRVDADDDVRAVVVTGRGRAFCAGYDLSGGGGFDVYERARERGTEELQPGDIPRDDAAEGASSFLEKRPPRFPLTVGRDLPAAFPWREEPPFTPPTEDERRRSP
jgi:hypothetical protein